MDEEKLKNSLFEVKIRLFLLMLGIFLQEGQNQGEDEPRGMVEC